MKSTFSLMRVWAALTGLALALGYFVAIALGVKLNEMLPMLIAAIGGFELALFGQDLWLKRRQHNG